RRRSGQERRRQSARRRSGSGRRRRNLGGRRTGRRSSVSSDTGTRQLAEGIQGYRLVRREDIELADVLPGRSSGLTSCRLVGGTLGSTHMGLALVSLVEGHVDAHVHSYETGFYVLDGEPLLYLDGRGVELRSG